MVSGWRPPERDPAKKRRFRILGRPIRRRRGYGQSAADPSIFSAAFTSPASLCVLSPRAEFDSASLWRCPSAERSFFRYRKHQQRARKGTQSNALTWHQINSKIEIDLIQFLLTYNYLLHLLLCNQFSAIWK